MAPKKANVRIVLKESGSLSKYGYHVTDVRSVRRIALDKAMADRPSRDKLNKLLARINVLSIYFKNKNPLYTARADEDEKYIRSYREKKFPLK